MSQTTAGTTSGTVLGQRFNVGKVMEHALRRAGYAPEKVGSEWLSVAKDLLFLQLSEYVNFGFPLWTRQQSPLGIQIGSPNVPTPYGTVDVIHVYWRTFNAWRGAATLSTGADGSLLVGGQSNADIPIVGPNPGVIVDFGTATQIDTIGVLPGPSTGFALDGNGNPILDGTGNPVLATPSSYTASLEVLTSEDGLTFTNVMTLPSTTFRAGQWAYFDLEPSISAPFVQIMLPGTAAWILNQVNFCLANSSQTDMGKENIDDYYNLPNKFFQAGQPNTAYVDRIADQPNIKIWPCPNAQAFYNGTVVSLQRRYIEDPGEMTDTLEVPARWFNGVVARLGVMLMDELPDLPEAQPNPISAAAKVQRRQNLDVAATKAEAGFWSEERDKSTVRIMPNLGAYTR